MHLQYVGSKPIVSAKGISFDKTKPDHYTFLTAAIEFLDALESQKDGEKDIDLRGLEIKEYNSSELFDMLEKYCTNLEDIFDAREEKTDAFIEKYISDIKENERLTNIEKEAWIGNVQIMRNYYMQYITNESAYECALHLLADKLHQHHIETIHFPIGRNHGLLLNNLDGILRDHKPPYDVTLTIEEDNDGKVIGILNMNRNSSHKD